MSPGGGSSRPDAYAREIERAWSRILDRPVVLSPKDWALISDWHARAIPLPLVLESMQHATERPRGRSAPRNLGYVAPAVEEAWQVVLDGRRASTAPVPDPPAVDPADAWRARIDAEGRSTALGRLLSELLEAYEAGATPQTIDLRLNERLETSVCDELRVATCRQIDAELLPFIERMDRATLDRTRRAAVVDRLRRALDLPFLDPTRR
jgi:hypothetical protein